MVSRRDILKLSAAAVAGSLTGYGAATIVPAPYAFGSPLQSGWINSPEAKERFTDRQYWRASDFDNSIRGTGRNKVVRLWKLWERIAGHPFLPHFQEIGDCVAQACALGLETQSAVRVAAGEPYEWEGKISTEALYIAARIEIGRGVLGTSDGATGSWMVDAAANYGVLKRDDYGNGFDVRVYNPQLAKRLSSARRFRPGEGIPAWLEPIMAKQKLLRAVRIDGGFDQASDYVANGYPILLCSSVGYTNQPDQDGFLQLGAEPWSHSMLLWAIDTLSRRQGGNIANSWGTQWLYPGPIHRHGCPPGCFWADRRNIDLMLRQNDSYALVEYRGPRKREQLYSF